MKAKREAEDDGLAEFGAEAFFSGHPDVLRIYRAVAKAIDDVGAAEIRVSKSIMSS